MAKNVQDVKALQALFNTERVNETLESTRKVVHKTSKRENRERVRNAQVDQMYRESLQKPVVRYRNNKTPDVKKRPEKVENIGSKFEIDGVVETNGKRRITIKLKG